MSGWRWCNQLNPNAVAGPFTKEEDDTILEQHAIHGNKWAVISRAMPGRTDNQVKNRFNSTLRRLICEPKEGSRVGEFGMHRPPMAPVSPKPGRRRRARNLDSGITEAKERTLSRRTADRSANGRYRRGRV